MTFFFLSLPFFSDIPDSLCLASWAFLSLFMLEIAFCAFWGNFICHLVGLRFRSHGRDIGACVCMCLLQHSARLRDMTADYLELGLTDRTEHEKIVMVVDKQ